MAGRMLLTLVRLAVLSQSPRHARHALHTRQTVYIQKVLVLLSRYVKVDMGTCICGGADSVEDQSLQQLLPTTFPPLFDS